MKYYRLNKSLFVTPSNLVVENSVIIFEEKPKYHKRTKQFLKNKYDIFCQGSDSKMSLENFTHCMDAGYLDEIEKPSDKFLNDFVYPSAEYKKRKKMILKAKKEMPEYKSIFSTLHTWIFQTKGSSAATYASENKFLKNPKHSLKETVLGGGMKAKPGSPVKNRGTRQSPIANEKKWMDDPTTLTPNGIRKGDHASFSECCNICDDLVIELISIYDAPTEFVEYFKQYGYEKKHIPHIDYFYKTVIGWNLFELNTHHSKEKGLEFCHIDPDLEYPTVSGNVTIGLCTSNRHQGGFSLDYTDKKLLIRKIVNKGYENDVHILNEMTLQDLEKLYFENEYK